MPNQISLAELLKNPAAIIRRLQSGERFELTDAGVPVARMEPVRSQPFAADDSFFSLIGLADRDPAELSNEQMDDLIDRFR